MKSLLRASPAAGPKVSGRTSRVLTLTAPNPSPMTLDGTNSYLLLGEGEALVIDPGPPDAVHVRALAGLALQNGCTIGAIAVTHGHPDHAPGAALLRERTGAPVYAHPAAAFPHDRPLADGDEIALAGATVRAFHAPGHASDHVVLWYERESALFTGDVIIGRGTVVIAPPNGDMRAYQSTLRRLRADFSRARTIFGGHGERVDAPREKIDAYIAHRELRERQIRGALLAGERTIPQLVEELYRDVDAVVWPAAARQVLAYLIALEREGSVRARQLVREPNDAERAILEPDLARSVDPANAAVARAELGYGATRTHIDAYALVTP